MKRYVVIIIGVFIVGVSVSACHGIKPSYSGWEHPEDTTHQPASELSTALLEAGILYPANDLHDPLLSHRKIVINHEINEHTSKDVVRKLLYLNVLSEVESIDLYISTQGGWYDSAFTIIDTFHAIKAPVNTICIGGCYSAGAVLMASGTGKRRSYSNALFSIHLHYAEDSHQEVLPYGAPPDRVNAYLQKYTALPSDWFPLDDDRYYYLTAEQALSFKLIDEVVYPR